MNINKSDVRLLSSFRNTRIIVRWRPSIFLRHMIFIEIIKNTQADTMVFFWELIEGRKLLIVWCIYFATDFFLPHFDQNVLREFSHKTRGAKWLVEWVSFHLAHPRDKTKYWCFQQNYNKTTRMDGLIEEELVFMIPKLWVKCLHFFCLLQKRGPRYREMRLISNPCKKW